MLPPGRRVAERLSASRRAMDYQKHLAGRQQGVYGTTQNERANNGILITTSHYTSAARQFAKELPLQLIDGANLLSLLEREAGVHAKIDFPEGWADPTMSVSND